MFERLLITFIDLFAIVFNVLILIRVLGSWAPQLMQGSFGGFIKEVTEPVLAPIRRLLPGGGMLDISPIIAIFAIQGLQYGVRALLGAL